MFNINKYLFYVFLSSLARICIKRPLLSSVIKILHENYNNISTDQRNDSRSNFKVGSRCPFKINGWYID